VRKYNCDMAQKIIEDTNSSKKAYKFLTQGKKSIIALKREDGTISHDKTEILALTTEFYKNLYESKMNVVPLDEQTDTEPIEEIIEEEIQKTTKALKNGKAPGPDNIVNELLKRSANITSTPLALLVNKCLNKGSIPENWRNASVILLYKKGDPKEPKNYRPINLLSHLYKLFTKILTDRISAAIKKRQTKDQAGFHSNRSATDHLQALNQLREKANEYHTPILLAFVDYEKAFDSAETNAVMNALKEQQVHPNYVRLLQNIYESATSTIQLDEEGQPFAIQRGVRQRDSISPKLFISCLDAIFQKIRWNEKGYGIKTAEDQVLTNLRFADDIVLADKNPTVLQTMLHDLHQLSLNVGLRMNKEKTKIMATKLENSIATIELADIR